MSNKYTDVFLDIESIFGTDAWIAEEIKAVASNFTGDVGSSEFVKIEFIMSDISADYNRDGIAGQIIMQVYVEAGFGMKRTFEIAGILDNYLQSKTFTNGTRTETSVLNIIGSDTDNPALFRADYTVGFTNF